MSREEDGRRALLREVMDELIPPSADGSFPGAGELGVGERIEEMLAQQPELGRIIEQGLASIRRLAESRNSSGFGELSRSQRAARGPRNAGESPIGKGRWYDRDSVGR